MPSTYPTTLDTLPTSNANSTPMVDTHAEQHNEVNDAVMAIQSTLGTDPQGAEADVAARLTAIEGSLGGTVLQVDVVHVADSPFSWIENVGAKWHHVILIGGGGGGASGNVRPGGQDAGGGNGGAGAGYAELSIAAGIGNQTVTVGAGGAGGGRSWNSAYNAGSDGGATSFGSILSAPGGDGAYTNGPGQPQTNAIYRAGVFANSSTGGTATTLVIPTGGGRGGSVGLDFAIPGVEGVGAAGAGVTNSSLIFPGGIVGGAQAPVRTAGNPGRSYGVIGTGGGGGGGINTGANGSNGGAGGLYGGGGGGGSGARPDGGSGAGGAGGAGIAIITQYG
jgi:hypothetical protein